MNKIKSVQNFGFIVLIFSHLYTKYVICKGVFVGASVTWGKMCTDLKCAAKQDSRVR